MSEAADTTAPAVELTPRERRAARERARRQVEAAERERIAAQRAKEAAPVEAPAAAQAAAAPEATPKGRTDEDRERDAARFLLGVLFPLLAFLARWTPWRLDLARFTPDAAAEDAKAWVPLARRYRLVDVALTWASWPASLVSRCKQLAVPREGTTA